MAHYHLKSTKFYIQQDIIHYYLISPLLSFLLLLLKSLDKPTTIHISYFGAANLVIIELNAIPTLQQLDK